MIWVHWLLSIVGGLGVFLFGMRTLSDAIRRVSATSFREFLSSITQSTWVGTVTGLFVTSLIQSSSAATALTLAAMVSGLIGLESALAMVLGENIGTTLTANLAAVVGNRTAKRVARIHFLINVSGALWMIWLIPVMASALSSLFAAAESDEVRNGYVLAMFHTTFNVLNGLVMGLFIESLVKFSKKLVWSEDVEGESTFAASIPGRIVDARLSLEEVQNDFRRSASLLRRMTQGVEELFGLLEPGDRADVLNNLVKWEEKTDRIEQSISAKLSGIAQHELSPELSGRLAALSAINPDFERVGDNLLSMAWQMDAKAREGVYFMPKQRTNLLQMLELLREAIKVMDVQLKSADVDLDAVAEVEGKINALQAKLREKHVKDVEKGKYSASSGILYSELLSSLEECGDRVAHVSSSLSGAQEGG